MENKNVNKILSSYVEKQPTKYDELKKLDQKVKRPAKIFAYIFGILGTLILGVGMCFCMDILLEGLMAVGIVEGVVGIAMVCANYFIYKAIFNKNKQKYAQDIMNINNEILNA